MSDWSAKNPYMTHITENFILNGEGSRKETRHIVFALGDSGLDYKVGDALGVIAETPRTLSKNFWTSKAGTETPPSPRTTVSAPSTTH